MLQSRTRDKRAMHTKVAIEAQDSLSKADMYIYLFKPSATDRLKLASLPPSNIHVWVAPGMCPDRLIECKWCERTDNTIESPRGN